jgi:hypothetical protein
MYENGQLAYTGVGVTLLGQSIGLPWIVGTGIVLVGLGALLVRRARNRGGKK